MTPFSREYLTRCRPPRHGNSALKSQGKQDKKERQIVQGAGQPTRPTLSAGGARVPRQYQVDGQFRLGTLDSVRLPSYIYGLLLSFFRLGRRLISGRAQVRSESL
jgi:hypothetical protein